MSNGFLTLISTSDMAGDATNPNTAQIYRLLTGNTVSGNVIVQRYASGEGRIYRYLSSPVADASVASWQDDFPITGSFSDPTYGPDICGVPLRPTTPSLYIYNESVAGTQQAGYEPYPVAGTAASNPLQVGRGYAAFIRECTNPTVIDVTGTINQGTITYPVTFTDTGNGLEDGYNLVGNPYPCTIDWDVPGWTKTRISPVIAVTDNGTGVTRYWDGDGDPSTLANGQIAPGQAFWVRATGASPALRSTENVKGIGPNQSGEFYRMPTHDVLTIGLSDGKVKDLAFIKIRSESKATLDDWDAPKLNNESFDLFTMSDDKIKMAINSVNALNCTAPITLGVRNLKAGKHTLSISTTGLFENYRYTLVDHYTGEELALTGAYEFEVDLNPSSKDGNRFSLKLSERFGVVNAASCGNGSVTLRISDLSSGQTVKWYDTESSTKTLGTGSSFTTPVLNKTSTYYASIEGASCTSGRIPVIAEIVHLEQPTIVANGDMLTTNVTDGQWLYNGAPITGATSSQLKMNFSGIYSIVSSKKGCSEQRDYVYTAELSDAISVYPNPIGDNFKIRANINLGKIDQAVLIKNTGEKVILGSGDLGSSPASEIVLDASDISAGLYILEITAQRSKYYIKVIKH
jgi:trimeric autotransporter adhesin